MGAFRLALLAARYHWDAHRASPANFFAAVFGMVINNLIVLWGLWVMLFDGKVDGDRLAINFIALNAMITVAWGSIEFFAGGMRALADYIEDGTLEPMLATPRNPLILIGISQSSAPALGDILQGFVNLAFLFATAPLGLASGCFAFTFVSAAGFLGLFIFAGSLGFFLPRGSTLARLLIECNLSFSFYPSGQVFDGKGRLFLYVLPAAAAAILPMDAIEQGTWGAAGISIVAALGFLLVACRIFALGLKRYQTASYVSARA